MSEEQDGMEHLVGHGSANEGNNANDTDKDSSNSACDQTGNSSTFGGAFWHGVSLASNCHVLADLHRAYVCCESKHSRERQRVVVVDVVQHPDVATCGED